ncbi:MAG: response regulator [Bacteroidia bacterium]
MIYVGITDDRREIRENIAQIIARFPDLQIVLSARDGADAVDQIKAGKAPLPQVLLMDIEMRKMDGIEATQRIKSLEPEIKIIMLSIFEEEDRIFAAIRAGASGYLLKDEAPDRIVQAIRDVQEGRMPMSPLVAGKALDFLRLSPAPSSTDKPEDFGLTPREIDILEPLASGKTYTEIAESLFISPKTVRRHIENIYRKLAVNSKVEASNLVQKKKWFW